jgi:hypothetical protein
LRAQGGKELQIHASDDLCFALLHHVELRKHQHNSPLRNQNLMDQKTSHKLAATVYMLDMSIKQSPAMAFDDSVPLSLYRGIGNRKIPDKFKTEGTELLQCQQ